MLSRRITLLILIFPLLAQAQQTPKMSAREYIEKYKTDAIKDMLRTGVPASITLAQGMLESNNGNSKLALEANNHFGIKCHKDWTGASLYQDDDAKNECFRKYNSVLESFDDHSNFLRTRQRYAFLFDIDPKNYKAWAEGLKKAGYATNPQYPQLLIKIIEDYQLYELDNSDKAPEVNARVANNSSAEIQYTNRTPYVISKKGDSFYKLAEKYNLDLWEIFRYNDLERDANLTPGTKVYIKPKRRRAEQDFHIANGVETMQEISQLYGVKLKVLYRKNRMEPGTQPQKGQQIWLRKKKPRD